MNILESFCSLQSFCAGSRHNSLLKSTHQATVAWASERKREMRTTEHLGCHLGQATCHPDTIFVLFSLENVVGMFNNLFCNVLWIVGGTLHKVLHHRIEDFVWSSLLLSTRRGFFLITDANKMKNRNMRLLVGHKHGLTHHLIQDA